MAKGLKYPKELPSSVVVSGLGGDRKITDTLSELAIVPYFGYWGVLEIMKTKLGSGCQLAVVRDLESYPTLSGAKAYIEGFMAGAKPRKE